MAASLCAICLDPLSSPLASINPCGQCFHMACVEEWRVRQQRHYAAYRCPMCNQTVQSQTKLYLNLPQFLLEPVDGEEEADDEDEEDMEEDEKDMSMLAKGSKHWSSITSPRRTRSMRDLDSSSANPHNDDEEDEAKPPAKKMKTRSASCRNQKPPAVTAAAVKVAPSAAATTTRNAKAKATALITENVLTTKNEPNTTRQYQRRIRHFQKMLISRTREHLQVERTTMAEVERVKQEVFHHKKVTEERFKKAEERLKRTEAMTQAATRDIIKMKATYDSKIRVAEIKLTEHAVRVQQIGQAHHTLLYNKLLQMQQERVAMEPVARRTRQQQAKTTASTATEAAATITATTTKGNINHQSRGDVSIQDDDDQHDDTESFVLQFSRDELETMEQGLDDLGNLVNILQEVQNISTVTDNLLVEAVDELEVREYLDS